MSTVLYVCSVEGCGGKGFDEPGGTRLVCRHHPAAGKMVQHEVGGTNLDARFREISDYSDNGVILAPKDQLQDEPDAVKRAALNEQYFQLTGTKADRRWSLTTLESNVQFAQEQQEQEPAR